MGKEPEVDIVVSTNGGPDTAVPVIEVIQGQETYVVVEIKSNLNDTRVAGNIYAIVTNATGINTITVKILTTADDSQPGDAVVIHAEPTGMFRLPDEQFQKAVTSLNITFETTHNETVDLDMKGCTEIGR